MVDRPNTTPIGQEGLILPGQIMWNTWQGKLTKGLAYLGA